MSQGKDNEERIRLFFQTHLCATSKECAQALGVSKNVVSRVRAIIRSEWVRKDLPPDHRQWSLFDEIP